MEELRRKAKSMEQEYADEEKHQERQMENERQKDIARERERVAAAVSASTSQTSLSLRQSISGKGTRTNRAASATSSSTSLAFKDTESESGSQKGTNRSSFMRFMKGRSSEDDGSQSPTIALYCEAIADPTRSPSETEQKASQAVGRRLVCRDADRSPSTASAYHSRSTTAHASSGTSMVSGRRL